MGDGLELPLYMLDDDAPFLASPPQDVEKCSQPGKRQKLDGGGWCAKEADCRKNPDHAVASQAHLPSNFQQ